MDMDYKDFLTQIQEDVNRQTQDILGQSQQTINEILGTESSLQDKTIVQSTVKIERLAKDSRLEEVTKAKIGTFEKLYQAQYVSDSKVPLYGYEDLDYATLVNLLASALEIELNMSLYQAIRREAGIEMPEHFNKDAGYKAVNIGDLSVNLGKKDQMFGALLALLSKYKQSVTQVVGDAEAFKAFLSKIIKYRNAADHKELITKEQFLDFYAVYSLFFNKNIEGLLDLKQSFRISPSKYATVSYGDVSTYNAAADDYINNLKGIRGETARKQSYGVIFTDTRKLAYKYFGEDKFKCEGDIYSRSSAIQKTLLLYVENLGKYGINYTLIDLGCGKYDYILDERNDLSAYMDILQDICEKEGISSDNPNNLFIIGGADVIPMARFHNPGQDPEHEVIDSKCLDNTVDSDLPYAYELQYIQINKKGELSLDALSGSIGKPRFHVGRLPLENGYMKTSIENDIYSYLNRSIAAFANGGIVINAPLMTTCRNAMEVGAYMIQDLPVMSHEDSPEDMSTLNMITSPSLAFNKDPKGRYTPRGTQTYATKIAQSDMLIFLLHGSGVPSNSYYFGDYNDEKLGRIQPVAFDPHLLDTGEIKCIATVSCFGAKFIEYDRSNSTLLSSIYRDTLCFMGSSRSAFGDFDDTLEVIKKETGKNTPRYSVRLMNYYLHLIFSGVPVAEALSRAKIKYLSGVTSEEYPEGIPAGMTTILEFNYYGDPALFIQPRIIIAESYNQLPESLPGYHINGDGWRREYRQIESTNEPTSSSLLSKIRGIVDERFGEIHTTIADKLYRELGVPPRELHTLYKFSNKNGDCGYSVRYRHTEGDASSDTIVITDLLGSIKDIYHTF